MTIYTEAIEIIVDSVLVNIVHLRQKRRSDYVSDRYDQP